MVCLIGNASHELRKPLAHPHHSPRDPGGFPVICLGKLAGFTSAGLELSLAYNRFEVPSLRGQD